MDNPRKKTRDCSTEKPVKVNWTKIWHCAFTKPESGQEIVLLFNYYLDQSFQAAIIRVLPRRSRNSLDSALLKVPVLYNSEIPAKNALQKDLQHLCWINAIDPKCHKYYNDLKCTEDTGNTAPDDIDPYKDYDDDKGEEEEIGSSVWTNDDMYNRRNLHFYIFDIS